MRERFCQHVRETSRQLSALPRAGLPEFLEPGVTTDGRVYVVGPYVPGASIVDHVTTRRSSAADRIKLAARLCTLVADLHRHGIVHGSLKSTNVIVTESRTVSFPALLDVGVVPAITYGRGLVGGRGPETGDGEGEGRDVRALGEVLTEVVGESTESRPDRRAVGSRARRDVPVTLSDGSFSRLMRAGTMTDGADVAE